MNLGFTVRPAGIEKEPGIKFDISRRRNAQAILLFNGQPVKFKPPVQNPEHTPYPGGDEWVNDDGRDGDEDVEPMHDHIFSFDNPGWAFNRVFGINDTCKYFGEGNFEEFVRVRVDGNRPTGNNTISGSRCSSKALWYSRLDVEKKANVNAFEINTQEGGKDNPPLSKELPK